MSLRWKIAGGYALMLLLIALLGWITVSQFLSLRNVQEEVFDDAVPGLVVVDEIVRSYTAQSASVRGALIGNMPVLLAQYEAEAENSRFWEERANTYFRAREERELLLELTDAGESFRNLVDEQVIPLAQRGHRSQAFRILGQEGSALITEIEDVGSLLREQQREVVLDSEAQVRAGSRRTLVTVVGVLALALLLGVMLASVLPRRLAANVGRLVGAARGIERGDLDQRIDIRSRDEIGELAQRFSDMQLGLRRLRQLAMQDRELQIAASIQRNLLQRRLPEVPGTTVIPIHRQANLVGGDWYDVDAVDGEIAIAVGDASGKGIAAALMATVALGTLRAERARGSDPETIITSINGALVEATEPESFTTLLYVVLEPMTGAVRWMNMGHHPPLLVRGRRDEPDAATPLSVLARYVEGPMNRVLGWFEDPGVKETSTQLDPGDRLLLFTDGVIEAKSPAGEIFGEDRLAEAVRRHAHETAPDMAADVVAEVERFSEGKLDDDLTMLVVEFHGMTSSTRAG